MIHDGRGKKNVGFVGQLNRSNQHVKFQTRSFLCSLRFSCDLLSSSPNNLPKKTPQYLVGKGARLGIS